jgi:hypothetical protein
MKSRDQVTWISEQVYDAPDVTYTTEAYAGASFIRYKWNYKHGKRTGQSMLYGISEEHASQLIDKWNKAGSDWHYELVPVTKPDSLHTY